MIGINKDNVQDYMMALLKIHLAWAGEDRGGGIRTVKYRERMAEAGFPVRQVELVHLLELGEQQGMFVLEHMGDVSKGEGSLTVHLSEQSVDVAVEAIENVDWDFEAGWALRVED